MKKSSTPILVANTEWPNPKHLMEQVKSERMINSLIDMIKPLTPEESVGYAELVAYLMPAIQKNPVGSRVSKIYLFCVTKLMKDKVPKDIQVNELSDYELSELKRLKLWIYEKRGGKEKNPVIDAFKEVFK